MRSALPWIAVVSTTSLALAGPARAEPGDDLVDEVVDDAGEPGRGGAALDDDVARGALSPWTAPVLGPSGAAVATMTSGYDAARGEALFGSSMAARVAGRFGVRLGASYVGAREAVGADAALTVDVVEGRGGDLAVGASLGYEGLGFNLTPAAVARVAAARAVGAATVVGGAAYGHGLEAGERFGELRLGALAPVGRGGLRLGIDSRLRVDLERDDDEPAGEAAWDAVAGPVATVAVGGVALTGTVGVSAVELRDGGERRTGAVGAIGVGTAF